MIKGVFFDLGGTLVSYHNVNRTHAPLLLEALARLGAADEPRRIKHAYQQAVQETTRAYADKDYYLHRHFFQDSFHRCCDRLSVATQPAVTSWYLDEHARRLCDCLEVKPDCHGTLADLKSRGLYLSIVSNIDDEMLEPIVAREAFARHLDHWTSSEAARSCKPHRRFFEVCLEKSGLAAQDVLFVGDSPEHDIDGANALGMRTVLVVNDGGEPPPLQSGRTTAAPDHTIRSLRELLALVESPAA
jgi:putative hydrolase of the HAD superfamily